MSIKQFAIESGLSPSTVKSRMLASYGLIPFEDYTLDMLKHVARPVVRKEKKEKIKRVTIAQISKDSGINYYTIRSRLKDADIKSLTDYEIGLLLKKPKRAMKKRRITK